MSDVRANKGFHPIVEQAPPHIFVDGCMQVWPDADFANAHKHCVTAYAVTSWRPKAPLAEALQSLMYYHLIARKHQNLSVALSVQDIVKAKEENRSVFLLVTQDGGFIETDLSRIEAFYRLGLRMMIPAYNATNQICDGCLDTTQGGLSLFGQRVIEECNRVGLLVDCSHLGRKSSLDIIHHSSDPVVFSHSNVKALVNHPRNIDDEQIVACVERGGVIGVTPFGPFTLKPGQTTWPTLNDFIDHIDYIAQLTGSTSHIALATDMSLGTYPYHQADPWGDPAYPPGSPVYNRVITDDVRSPRRALQDFNSFSHLPAMIERLTERGYTDTDISGILGGNFLRIFGQVWKDNT